MKTRSDWAARYVERYNLALVEIPPGHKSPLRQGWNEPGGYITDADEARQLWDKVPDHGMGAVLIPSGLCSLDVDSPEHALPALFDVGIDLDELRKGVPTIQGNPSRYRLMFKAPEAVLQRKTLVWPANDGAKPITVFELRAGAVQDVLPPTIHPGTGEPYRWLVPPGDKFPPLPLALLELWTNWDSYRQEFEGACPWAQPFKPDAAPRGTGARADVIAAFNQAHTAEALLKEHAYKQRGKRWISPTSESGLAGVALLDGGRVYSHHAADPLNDDHSHDAFDLYRILEHGGDLKAAIKAAAEALGIGPERNSGRSPGEWPEPLPLAAKVASEPYPLDALPDTIRAAVEEVQAFTKAPIPLVASSALAALSLAIQAHADVKRAEKLTGPVGLFLLTIADSGERKSTCEGFFTTAIREYDQQQAEMGKPEIKRYAAKLSAWSAEREGILLAIKQARKSGKPIDALKAELGQLENDKPTAPRIPRLKRGDETQENLAWLLAREWPSAGVLSSEAGVVLGAHGMGKDSIMRYLAFLNVLWDGGTHHVGRRTSESFDVRGARLTVALQIQEATLRSFFDQSKGLARGIGFLARFLVAWPESTQGSRPFAEPSDNWPALAAFNRRIAALLDDPVSIDDEGALSPELVSLTPDAKNAWVAFHNAIERELRTGGELYDVRDVASKSADNAARLGALFQTFEYGMGGAVGLESFESASRNAAWHLNEARRFFGELALPAELANAVRLDSWLLDYCRRERTHLVGKNHTRQHGPLRDGAALNAAIRELADLDRVRLVKEGKRLTIQVNPALVRVAA